MFINYSLLIILFSHATCLHTRLTEFFLNYVSSSQTTNLNLAEPQLPALSCLLYHKGHQSDERTCNIMFLLSQNFYKCKQAVYCVFCLRLSLQNCCCLFICLSAIFILHFVVASLLLNPLFYTDIVAKSLFIRWSCKETNFIFWAFVYHFKNIISTFVISSIHV